MIFLRKIFDFAPQWGAKRVPDRSKIASEMSVGLKVYKKLFQEGSERAPKPKNSSMGALRAPREPWKTPLSKKNVWDHAGLPLGEPK